MEFKVGDIVKKPNGKYCFQILAIHDTNRRSANKFGDWYLLNLTTGRKYLTHSNQGWILKDPFKPLKIDREYLKFDFKNGI